MKRNIFFLIIVALIAGIIFYLIKPKEIPIVKAVQNKNCFCSEELGQSLTACFDPDDMGFAVWNTKFDLSMAPFKLPFKKGVWIKNPKEIQINYSDGTELQIPHISEKKEEYPLSIDIVDVHLKPQNCKDLDWNELRKKIQPTQDSVFLCFNSKDENKPNLGILFNFKEKIFTQWDGRNLFSQESLILESPNSEGEMKINGDLLFMQTKDGKEIQGKITQKENNMATTIDLKRGGVTFEVNRDECFWMEKSFRDIPLIKAKNVLCEKNKNDFVISVELEQNTIKVYSDLSKYSVKDYFEDKHTYELSNISIIGNGISFSTKDRKVKGNISKDGERIINIKIPKGVSQPELEFSRESCPPFFLTQKLWK